MREHFQMQLFAELNKFFFLGLTVMSVFPRALEDFEMLLRKAVDDPSSSTEAMSSKISVALGALDRLENGIRFRTSLL
jgi:hypothetical protein